MVVTTDLAKFYHCTNETKTINLAVKRHIKRFPERFMFQLTDGEYINLRFQLETSSIGNDYGGRRYNPYVLTEQGVAEEVSIRIMDAFVTMKHYIGNNDLRLSHI